MKGQLKVSTPEEYLEQVDDARKADIASLHALIRETAPSLAPFIQGGILAYGLLHYKYASGREGDSCHIGLSSNKNYISLYISGFDGETYLAERYKEALPKASIGKSCVRFKRLSDLDQTVLTNMIREGAAVSEPRA